MTIAIALSGANSIVLATDSREVATDGTHVFYSEDTPKLRILNDYTGVVFTGNIPGYDQWVIDLFNETFADKNSKSFGEIVKLFAQALNEDFYKYTQKQATSMTGRILEFVLSGYNRQSKPQIARIVWTNEHQLFIPRIRTYHYYITGITHIGNYLINKVKDDILNMNTITLQRLATLVIIETSTTEKAVNDKIQMAVIEKGEKLRFIATDEIEKLKSHVRKAIDKEELLKTLANH